MTALLRLIITRRRLLAAILFAMSLALAFPATSQAHAVLLRSDPAENAVLHAAPDQVHVWFSETLNATLSTVTVFNQANQRVDNRDASLAPQNTGADPTLMRPARQTRHHQAPSSQRLPSGAMRHGEKDDGIDRNDDGIHDHDVQQAISFSQMRVDQSGLWTCI